MWVQFHVAVEYLTKGAKKNPDTFWRKRVHQVTIFFASSIFCFTTIMSVLSRLFSCKCLLTRARAFVATFLSALSKGHFFQDDNGRILEWMVLEPQFRQNFRAVDEVFSTLSSSTSFDEAVRSLACQEENANWLTYSSCSQMYLWITVSLNFLAYPSRNQV